MWYAIPYKSLEDPPEGAQAHRFTLKTTAFDPVNPAQFI